MALPPHSARMASRPCRVAASMALSPLLASIRWCCPLGWMNVMATMSFPSSRCYRHGKAVLPAQRVVVTALRLAGDFDGSDLSGQNRQHHFALKARDELADAHMDAGPKADMTAGAAGDIVAVRI